jgi:hypothetical protein
MDVTGYGKLFLNFMIVIEIWLFSKTLRVLNVPIFLSVFLLEEQFCSCSKIVLLRVKINIYNRNKFPHKTVTELYANNILRHLFRRYMYSYGFQVKFYLIF